MCRFVGLSAETLPLYLLAGFVCKDWPIKDRVLLKYTCTKFSFGVTQSSYETIE